MAVTFVILTVVCCYWAKEKGDYYSPAVAILGGAISLGTYSWGKRGGIKVRDVANSDIIIENAKDFDADIENIKDGSKINIR
ncbi:MAG: hypothetical protein RL757_3242 [Bacteroidota bacterium]